MNLSIWKSRRNQRQLVASQDNGTHIYDKFEPAKNPLNRYSTIRKGLGMQKMNPGYTFSKKMLKEQPFWPRVMSVR